MVVKKRAIKVQIKVSSEQGDATKVKTRSNATNQLKVALVHDYLREYGGAERVLEQLHALFPDAPVYVAFVDQKALGVHWSRFQNWDIRTTWLARFPGITRIFSPLRIFAPHAFSKLDLSEYDIVISSTNAYMAKAVRVPNGTHICYCHTPPRALYGYSTMSDWKKQWWLRLPGELINHIMRIFDFQTAQAVDVFIANSQETARRIQKFYRRDSQVIFPPVQVPTKVPSKATTLSKQVSMQSPTQLLKEVSTKVPNQKDNSFLNEEYYLYVNRLAFAKHPEIAVQACLELQLPLKVVGTGPMLAQLKQLVTQADQSGLNCQNITFEGSVTDDELFNLYAQAKALMYPVEDEDFGMVPIEAMGYGVPVIAHASGGPLETIIDGKTGILFEELSVQGLVDAIQRCETYTFSKEEIYAQAQKYSVKEFKRKILALIE